MKEPKFRPYRESDLPLLHQMDCSCFPPGIAYSLEELGAFIRHPGAFTLVAEIRGEIIGFIVAHREKEHLGHIVTLDIPVEWRRRQIGTLLMNKAEEWLERNACRMVYLEAAVDNHPAIRFYEKRDYQSCQRVEGYYSDGTAALILAKTL